MRIFKPAVVLALAGLLCVLFAPPVLAEAPAAQKVIAVASGDRMILTTDSAPEDNSSAAKPEPIPGDVLVLYRSRSMGESKYGLSVETLASETAKLNTLALSNGAAVAKTYSSLSRTSGKVFALLHTDSKPESELLNELRANPDVLGASLNYKTHALTSPNDPSYGQLWGIPAISADRVWDEGLTGGSDVYVAVMDTGVSFRHEDISANFETDGYSRNFSDTSDYGDYRGHGTHVSGTIAAAGNNGVGVAGVNWTAKIIALKVLADDGRGQWDWTIDALNYLCELVDEHPDMHLAAINLSLRGYMPYSPSEMIENNNPMWAAFSAFSKKNRAVICVAAGNEDLEVGKPAPEDNWLIGYNKGDYCYPASLQQVDNMIVVANAQNTSEYTRNSSSNYSTAYVDVAAPGTGILSTVPGDGYESYDGTSMATPHVAGAAALLKSIFPEADAGQIKTAIIDGANKNYATDYTANGFLDVKAAKNILEGSVSPQPKILTASLVRGMRTLPYSITLSARGARPITWSLSSGELPDGLNLADDGTLSGTPTKAGSYTFTVKVENADGSDTKELTLKITDGKPEIVSGTLENGSIQELYSTQLKAEGPQPITWSLASGTLPPYLELSADGTISGAPSKAGTWTFSVRAQNSLGSSTKECTLTIRGIKPMILNLNLLPSAVLGKPYKKQLEAIGTGPMTWTVTDGALPNGLKLNKSSGLISGTPKKASSSPYHFTVKAENNEGTDYLGCSLYVDDMSTSSDITILTEKLPVVLNSVPYMAKLEASGTAPITWTIEEGELPAGISMNSEGVLRGIYKVNRGTYTFLKVKASNSTGSVSKHVILQWESATIDLEAKLITETLPDGIKGSPYTAYLYMRTERMSGGFDIAKGTLPPGVVLTKYGVLKGTPIKTGTYKFTVRGNSGGWDAYDKKEFIVKVYSKHKKPVIKTDVLSEGFVGIPYIRALSYTGTNDVLFKAEGTLPPGLSGLGYSNEWTSSYSLEGTPTQAGEYTFTVKAENSAGSTTKNIKIVISEVAPEITTILKDAVKGAPYNAELELFAPGLPAFSSIKWKITDGKLPEGLALSTNGRITGRPQETGTFNFTVEATYADGSYSKALTLRVITLDGVHILTEKLPLAVTNIPYSVQLEGYSEEPLKWSIVGTDELLDGLSLSESGVLSGIPRYDVWGFSGAVTVIIVKAENSAGSATKGFTFEINSEHLMRDNFTNSFGILGGSDPTYGFIVGENYNLQFHGHHILSMFSTVKSLTSLKVISGDFIPGLEIIQDGPTPLIVGSPIEAGTYTFTLRGENGIVYEERTYTATVRESIEYEEPVIIIGALPELAVGQSYYDDFYEKAAKGYAPMFTWSVIEGVLPPGLLLVNGGLWDGTPTKAGTYKFTVQTESLAGKDSKELSFTVTQSPTKPSVKTASLYTGAVGKPYEALLEAGGTHSEAINSNRWGIKSGSLPDGLMMTSEGKIMGIPTKKGSYTFTVLVKNTWGTSTKKFTIKIGDYEKPAITTASLSNATLNKSYSKKLAATGKPSASWSIINGALPDGMKLSSAGKISGTPTKAGTFTFTLKASNSAGQDYARFKLTVKGTAPKIKTAASLPAVDTGKPYIVSLDASGTKPITWTQTGGTLPKGLTLDGAAGTLSGTPTKKGTYTFTLKASNIAGNASRKFTLKVLAPLSTSGKFTSPGYLKAEYTSSITISGGTSPYTASLASGDSLPNGLTLSVSGKKIVLSGTPSKTGTYKFRLNVADKDGRNYTTSKFTVKITKPTISVIVPECRVGEPVTITFKFTGGVPPYKWKKSSGTFPTGLKFTYSEDGTTAWLKGTPTKAGTFKFTLKVTDANGSYTKTFTIPIAPASESSTDIIDDELPASPKEPEDQTLTDSDSSDASQPDEPSDTDSNIDSDSSADSDAGSSTFKTGLSVSSSDIVSSHSGRDSDLVTVKAGQPVTFIIGEWVLSDGTHAEVSDVTVLVNDEPASVNISDDGTFILPAERVSGDFKVFVRARAGEDELETEELYLSAE